MAPAAAAAAYSLLSSPPPPTSSTLPTKLNSSRVAIITHPFHKSRKPLHNGRMGLAWSATKVASIGENIIAGELRDQDEETDYGVLSMHHVGILCENLERSLDFYQNLLGLKINEARPHNKLPYRGAWLWVGSEMIHLMELPNPDPLTGRPEHGWLDRHACIAIQDVLKLKAIFDKAGHPYTLSRSGRPAIFTRDPDANALEFTQSLEKKVRKGC